ncbi:alpha/beta hydrolase [Telluria mixta]|uniref:Alpha/beta hydrolase n=1 Tax=Telluria mixta TaxID=34071 RepID=A0ABT2BWV6_9BURK|nr:alpha/beta hydrolase [Telluria mixta]MCS0629432.1 alpha/beta hydrolase [Telluria mixta]WEM96992.1 alpha/beta hydrolase [Telluria mixta]
MLKSILLLGALLATDVPAMAATRSCHLPGVEEALRCLTLPVPLEPGKPATLNLHVTIAPALRQGARPDPLFVLAGGPGEAGSDVLPLLSTAFKRVRATRDIVFVDQRGTGLSGKLECPSDADADAQLSDADADAALRRCIAAGKAPFAAYTTAAAARDIEAVRRALGYDRINLWGGSYGTRLAQAYARAYPAGTRALLLDAVAAPDQVIPAGGRDSQAALDQLFAQCAKDAACARAYPNLRGEFDALVGRLDTAPLTLNLPDPRTARPIDVTMTSARLLDTVRNMLYAPADARRLPFLVHSASAGRWQPFVARRNLAADLSPDGSPATLLHLAVVCAEDMPRFTPALAANDASPLTRTLADRLRGLCRAMNVPAVPYAPPTRIAAPVLLLSGALDPVTPPRRAQDAARFMDHAQLLTALNVGHGVSQLGCAPRLLRAFLDRPDAKIDGACLNEIPAPTFQLGSAGPQP